MCDGDEAALLAVAAQQGHHLQAGVPVHQAGRLVGKDDPRAMDHGPRHGRSLPLAARAGEQNAGNSLPGFRVGGGSRSPCGLIRRLRQAPDTVQVDVIVEQHP